MQSLTINTIRTLPKKASSQSPSLSEARKFSRFICSEVYKSLGSSTASKCLSQSEFTAQFETSADFIHLLTTSVADIIPLSIIVYALQLVEKIASVGNRKTAVGSEPYLFAIALIIAQKYVEDRPYANKCWVKLMNMPVTHINLLEREFLSCLQFNVSFPVQEYDDFFDQIQMSAKKWDNSDIVLRREEFKKNRVDHILSPPPSPFSMQLA